MRPAGDMDHETSDASAHSYFMPMVDMLAGVVFLLVIMLASSMLVTRPEFGQAEAMEQELARIQAELGQAQAAERLYLEPRRRARAATKLLLGRIAESLRRDGIETASAPDTGTLAFSAFQPFDGRSLSADGQRLASALAGALARELPCLAPAPAQPAGADCAAYGDVRLQTVALTVPAGADAAQARGDALRLLTAIVTNEPSLLALNEQGGSELMIYGVGEAGDPDARALLRIDMAVPAIVP